MRSLAGEYFNATQKAHTDIERISAGFCCRHPEGAIASAIVAVAAAVTARMEFKVAHAALEEAHNPSGTQLRGLVEKVQNERL